MNLPAKSQANSMIPPFHLPHNTIETAFYSYPRPLWPYVVDSRIKSTPELEQTFQESSNKYFPSLRQFANTRPLSFIHLPRWARNFSNPQPQLN